jgi:urea carboxylase
MCIYPMNSPGGYQLMGRTLPIWNNYGAVAPFTPDKPWLLEIFDQIRFHEVTEPELEGLRQRFSAGKYELELTKETFDFGAHAVFCKGVEAETAALKAKQAAASAVIAEVDMKILRRLEAEGYMAGGGGMAGIEDESKISSCMGEGFVHSVAPFAANVWDLGVSAGDRVAAGEHLCVLEAMKMETPVVAAVAGIVVLVAVEIGQMVSRGQVLIVIEATAARKLAVQ